MTQPNRILIIDDSPEDCAVYIRHLQRAGFIRSNVEVAHSATEGLSLCRTYNPDCILLDFSLPDSDGLDILAQLKQEFGEFGPAVIMVTGHGNEAVAVQAMKMGADDYLVKSLSQESLTKAIRSAVENVTLRRQIRTQQQEVARLSAEQTRLVAELEQRTAELSEADHRKNEFLAVLAHELRNPLGPIRNAANVIRLSSSPSNPMLEQARDIIDRQVGQMAHLIDDLLDVSRIVRGKILLRKQRLDWGALIRGTIEDHRGEIDADGLTLTLNLPESSVWIDGDPTRLSQIAGNSIDNARKFTPSGGTIEVSLTAAPETGMATLQVADSGEGLDAVMLTRMFESFSQADRSLDRSRGGLGLGLAIVKGLTELHGGTVTAASAGLGLGCQISVNLQLSPQSECSSATTRAGESAARPRRILIIEDNQDAATSLKMLLQKFGHNVACAHNGQSGLETARHFQPELVLCDIGLSNEMNGYEVARKFRQEPAISSAYLVALTGYGRDEDQQQAAAAGFNLHLTKPIEIETLQELATGILS
ncbi:MAG: Chemotaxis protein methyltransferase CheR [Planctomycetaceae bacterium]|nr:Chemotaxis protein methyltransferase CheR [Planctomycetaceae bacterium]